MPTMVDYQNAVSHTLGGFQLLEESLKTYIEIYHEAVRKHLPPSMCYLYSRADVQDAALGKLVNVFAKTSANAELIQRLRARIKTRDHLAHRALLRIYESSPQDLEAADRTDNYARVATEISELLRDLARETIQLASLGTEKPALPAPNCP